MCKVKLQETQKSLPTKFPAGSVSSCKTTSQLDSLTGFLFDLRGSCLVIIFVEVVSDWFSPG